jgi:uncharacterized RDD family membrane protein YckC
MDVEESDVEETAPVKGSGDVPAGRVLSASDDAAPAPIRQRDAPAPKPTHARPTPLPSVTVRPPAAIAPSSAGLRNRVGAPPAETIAVAPLVSLCRRRHSRRLLAHVSPFLFPAQPREQNRGPDVWFPDQLASISERWYAAIWDNVFTVVNQAFNAPIIFAGLLSAPFLLVLSPLLIMALLIGYYRDWLPNPFSVYPGATWGKGSCGLMVVDMRGKPVGTFFLYFIRPILTSIVYAIPPLGLYSLYKLYYDRISLVDSVTDTRVVINPTYMRQKSGPVWANYRKTVTAALKIWGTVFFVLGIAWATGIVCDALITWNHDNTCTPYIRPSGACVRTRDLGGEPRVELTFVAQAQTETGTVSDVKVEIRGADFAIGGIIFKPAQPVHHVGTTLDNLVSRNYVTWYKDASGKTYREAQVTVTSLKDGRQALAIQTSSGRAIALYSNPEISMRTKDCQGFLRQLDLVALGKRSLETGQVERRFVETDKVHGDITFDETLDFTLTTDNLLLLKSRQSLHHILYPKSDQEGLASSSGLRRDGKDVAYAYCDGPKPVDVILKAFGDTIIGSDVSFTTRSHFAIAAHATLARARPSGARVGRTCFATPVRITRLGVPSALTIPSASPSAATAACAGTTRHPLWPCWRASSRACSGARQRPRQLSTRGAL